MVDKRIDSNLVNKMGLLLDFIDLFVKRLVTPSVLIFAAVFLSMQVNGSENIFILIRLSVYILIGIACIYTAISIGVICQKINDLVVNKALNIFFSVLSSLLYLVLFVVAIITGIEKLSK